MTLRHGATPVLCLALACWAETGALAQEPATARTPAERVAPHEADADPMVTAWLHDLLGSPPTTTLAAYHAAIVDPSTPGEHRVRAAARGLPLAIAGDDADATQWWARTLTELMAPRTPDPEALVQRLRLTHDAVRAWVDSDDNDLERARALAQRLNTEPWKMLDALANRPLPAIEALERSLRAAEARGDTAEAERLRQELAPRRATDLQRPRLIQVRRWARDVLEWELAGEHEKAQRLLTALGRRRAGRGPITMARFESEMRGDTTGRVTPQERRLLDQALAAARERALSGDQRGVNALVVAALTLLLSP